jgi:hypothetical protein
MKQIINFKWDDNEVAVSANEILVPRIGEKIDISNLLKSNDDREIYNKFKENESVYVIDVSHQFNENQQNIHVTLSNELGCKSDFAIKFVQWMNDYTSL